jgi:hypothetical protein
MPFHPGGHKPKGKLPTRKPRIRDRLFVSFLGGLGIFGGWFRIQHGQEYILNWWGNPVYAQGLIIAGIIVAIAAWIPLTIKKGRN